MTQGVVEIQIRSKQNDEQVAVVFFTMVRVHPCWADLALMSEVQSAFLVLLKDLDPVFDQPQLHTQLQTMLDGVKDTVLGFGKSMYRP